MEGVPESVAAPIPDRGAVSPVVIVDPPEFLSILVWSDAPLVATARVVHHGTYVYQYLTSYKGLAFYTEAGDELPLSEHVDVVVARRIHVSPTYMRGEGSKE